MTPRFSSCAAARLFTLRDIQRSELLKLVRSTLNNAPQKCFIYFYIYTKSLFFVGDIRKSNYLAVAERVSCGLTAFIYRCQSKARSLLYGARNKRSRGVGQCILSPLLEYASRRKHLGAVT